MSRDTIYVIDTGKPADFKIELQDSRGRVPERQSYKKNGLAPEEAKQAVVPIGPGQDRLYTLSLNDLYRLTAGKYRLVVRKLILLSDRQTEMVLSSAALSFISEPK